MLMLAVLRNKAPAMNVVEARPGEEKLSLPGCSLALAMTSFKVLASRPG
jgi:hypothetical protein